MGQDSNLSEIWKDIHEYEGLYQVSNMGRVKSLDRIVPRGNFCIRIKGAIKSLQPKYDGYLLVQLSKEGKAKTMTVHRLVALTFIPNNNNLPEVNHKDFDTANNCISNLEWASRNGNIAHSMMAGRLKCPEERRKMISKSKQKKVIGTNIETGEKVVFDYILQSGQGGFSPTLVCRCCTGKNKTHRGYVWEYCGANVGY